MNLTDEELIQELSKRFAQSRKAFSDLSVVHRKLLDMNRRLEASESLKSNFLSNIRNEINNPLNAIMGLSRQIGFIGGENGEIAVLAAMICAEAATLDFQMRNIFLAAELEAGVVAPRGTSVHVSAIITEVIDSLQNSAAPKIVRLFHDSPADGGKDVATIDSVFLRTIVSNLLANAIEYSNAGAEVVISSAMGADGKLLLSVRDHGIGIATQDQQRIFDRFVQLESGTTRSHPGHGLGLSITKALVDLMQGSISLESAPGRGSLFTVVLPPCTLSADDTIFEESGNLFIFDGMGEAQVQ